MPHLVFGLRRLRRDAEAWMLLEGENVIWFKDDVESIEVAGEAAHLDVITLADDDHVVAIARQLGDRVVRDLYERARMPYEAAEARVLEPDSTLPISAISSATSSA